MADHAHSTAASCVHLLEGSTPPDVGTLDKLQATPKPQLRLRPTETDEQYAAIMSLAKLHGLDAEVIELAERTEALALRERALWERCADLEDAVTRALPPQPVRAEKQHRLGYAEAAVDGVKTTTLTEPPGWRDEIAAVEASYAAAVAEHERLEAELDGRLGLPLAEKLASRATQRLSRWGDRLTKLAPRTYAGLRAKAAVLRATAKDGQLHDTWGQALAVSVGADAIRLIDAEAEERFLEDQARDGELFHHIASYASAMAEWDEADEAQMPFGEAWREACPPMPDALRARMADFPFRASGREPIEGSEAVFYVYRKHDIDKLRADPEPRMSSTDSADSPEGPGLTWRPNDRLIARKAEILAAWDAWQAEMERMRETTGLTAADAVVDAATERANRIEDAILDYQPRTFEGLQAKARWIASTPVAADRAEHVLRDLCRMTPVNMAPVRGGALASDDALLAAAAEFHRIDALQLDLCARHHRDCENIPGYAETEVAWRDSLQRVADLPAVGWSGITAKAALLKWPSVWHDPVLCGHIADSMAEDVLRVGGRAWDMETTRVPGTPVFKAAHDAAMVREAA